MSHATGWFDSAFGGTAYAGASMASNQQARKRALRTPKREAPPKRDQGKGSSNGCVDFSELFTPKTTSDVAVHSKKVAEVRAWLSSQLSSRTRGVLLLDGPCGSGKSSVVRVLCDEFDCELVGWECTDEFDISEDGLYEIHEVSEFESFSRLISGAKLPPSNRLKGYVILVENLPNDCYEDPSKLQTLLRSAWFSSSAPSTSRGPSALILCLSNVSSCWNLHPRRLLPEFFCAQHGIASISFNPVASTFLLKALKRAATILKIQVSDGDLRSVSVSAEGDLRRAVRSLQLALTSSAGRKQRLDCALIHRPDSLLSLFHLLGRLLYSKRIEEDENSVWKEAEEKLSFVNGRRPPPERDVNDVIADPPRSADDILLYLLEHEPRFAPDMQCLTRTLDAYSLADSYYNVWNHRNIFDEYSLQVGARSTMYYNFSNEKRKNGQYQLTKPLWRDLTTEVKRVSRVVEGGLTSLRKDDYYTLVIPMAGKTKCGLLVEEYLARPFGATSWQVGWEAYYKNSEVAEKRLRRPTERMPLEEAIEDDEEYLIENTDSDSDF